jgi:hypothetical protein
MTNEGDRQLKSNAVWDIHGAPDSDGDLLGYGNKVGSALGKAF